MSRKRRFALTPSQLKLVLYVDSYWKANGVGPTYRELADHQGRKLATVYEQVRRLCVRGVLTREHYANRTVQLSPRMETQLRGAKRDTAPGQAYEHLLAAWRAATQRDRDRFLTHVLTTTTTTEGGQ